MKSSCGRASRSHVTLWRKTTERGGVSLVVILEDKQMQNNKLHHSDARDLVMSNNNIGQHLSVLEVLFLLSSSSLTPHLATVIRRCTPGRCDVTGGRGYRQQQSMFPTRASRWTEEVRRPLQVRLFCRFPASKKRSFECL